MDQEKMTNKFKVGDLVEWAIDGNFELHRNSDNKTTYDIGAVIAVGRDGTPRINWARYVSTNGAKTSIRKVSQEPPFISMTKSEYERFRACLSASEAEFCTSERDMFDYLIKEYVQFQKSAKDQHQKITDAITLLEEHGYKVVS